MSSVNTTGKMRIKRGDIVMAITGDDADGKKTGKVLRVMPDKGRVLVEGFNYVRKHLKKSQDNPKGGIVEKEAPIHVSNLKLYTGEAKAPAAPKARAKKAVPGKKAAGSDSPSSP
jgi:large subunit ribosomal protein L24